MKIQIKLIMGVVSCTNLKLKREKRERIEEKCHSLYHNYVIENYKVRC
jgi:phosphoribosylformylglycinamidine (FGAM) synthase PurS component